MACAPGESWGCCILWVVGLGFVAGACVVPATELELAFSASFYDPGLSPAWFTGEALHWRWLYDYGTYPTVVVVVVACLGWLGSLVRPGWRRYRYGCALLALAVALGPGLLVNGLLKPYWGRPRPRQVQALGGGVPYRPWWQPGGPGTGQSFPSGHAAMGYVLVVGVCLVPRRPGGWLRVLVLVSALSYGTLLGFARIVQGGHFVSDVFWSGGLMCFVAGTLHAGLRALHPTVRPRDLLPCRKETL